LAVSTDPDVNDNPEIVHVPLDAVVADPKSVEPPEYKWIVVPAASTEVPEMVLIVELVQYEPLITGAIEAPRDAVVTVSELEAFDKQFVPEIAFAVIT
jgi:hypothetical protein